MKKGDAAILMFVILTAAGTLAFLHYPRNGSVPQQAEVWLNGKRSHTFDLRKSGTQDIGHHHICWEPGRIRIDASDCPDQNCVKRSWLSRCGESAICLPYRLILKTEGQDNEIQPLDAITF